MFIWTSVKHQRKIFDFYPLMVCIKFFCHEESEVF